MTAMSAPFAGGLPAKGVLGVLGSVFCRAYVDRGHLKVLPVKLPADAWHITAATLRTRAPHPLAKMFLDCAREVAKPLSLSDADD